MVQITIFTHFTLDFAKVVFEKLKRYHLLSFIYILIKQHKTYDISKISRDHTSLSLFFDHILTYDRCWLNQKKKPRKSRKGHHCGICFVTHIHKGLGPRPYRSFIINHSKLHTYRLRIILYCLYISQTS